MSKEIVWLGRSFADLREFPDDARREAGQKLRRVQDGLEPTDYRPMRDVGPGVIEIRIHIGGEYRVFYVARHTEAISSSMYSRRKHAGLRTTTSASADSVSGR